MFLLGIMAAWGRWTWAHQPKRIHVSAFFGTLAVRGRRSNFALWSEGSSDLAISLGAALAAASVPAVSRPAKFRGGTGVRTSVIGVESCEHRRKRRPLRQYYATKQSFRVCRVRTRSVAIW